MAFELALVSAHIATLSITGTLPDSTTRAVTINDDDDVRYKADPKTCPILEPDITRPLVVQTIQRNSQGHSSVAKQTLRYSAPYILLYWPFGIDDKGFHSISKNLKLTLTAIATAIVAGGKPASPIADLYLDNMIFGQTVKDRAGVEYHGAQINIGIMEFVN